MELEVLIPPPQTKQILFIFWMFFTFSLLTKAISPLIYISRKKP